MKYFLIASILCTILSASAHEGPCGTSMGSLDIWSEWYDFDDDVAVPQACKEIRDSYNKLNAERGYFAQFEADGPIVHQFRPTDDDPKERRFSCRLRITKFDLE